MENKIVILALLSLALILFGCTTPGVIIDNAYFGLDKNFTLMPGTGVMGSDSDIKISLVSINDSRCPGDKLIQCVWEGELGTTISVTHKTLKIAAQEINLGLTTKPSTEIFGYNIKLLDVNADNNTATFIVTKIDSVVDENKTEWFSINPKQCNSNTWDAWGVATGFEYNKKLYPSIVDKDHEELINWLNQAYNINVFDLKSRKSMDFVCEACSCPTGEEIAILVEVKHKELLETLGFTSLEPVACTMDAKICPDGSAVGRTVPFCEFEVCKEPIDCPIYSPPYCPNGKITSEIDSRGCSRPVCEIDNNVLLVLTEVPGFVMNPTTVTKTIYVNGEYSVETSSSNWDENKQDWDETTSFESGAITDANLSLLLSVIKLSTFFSLTEKDARACIADLPTKTLEINLEEKTNTIYGIGAECEKEKIADAYDIIDKVIEILPK